MAAASLTADAARGAGAVGESREARNAELEGETKAAVVAAEAAVAEEAVGAAEGEVAVEEVAVESADGERGGGEYGDSLSVLSSAAAVRRRLGEAERMREGVYRLRRVEREGAMACGE